MVALNVEQYPLEVIFLGKDKQFLGPRQTPNRIDIDGRQVTESSKTKWGLLGLEAILSILEENQLPSARRNTIMVDLCLALQALHEFSCVVPVCYSQVARTHFPEIS